MLTIAYNISISSASVTMISRWLPKSLQRAAKFNRSFYCVQSLSKERSGATQTLPSFHRVTVKFISLLHWILAVYWESCSLAKRRFHCSTLFHEIQGSLNLELVAYTGGGGSVFLAVSNKMKMMKMLPRGQCQLATFRHFSPPTHGPYTAIYGDNFSSP